MDHLKYRENQIELGCIVEEYNHNLSILIDNLECKDRAVVEQAVYNLKNTFHVLCSIVSDSLQG